MDLPPTSLALADSYSKIAYIYSKLSKSAKLGSDDSVSEVDIYEGSQHITKNKQKGLVN